MTLHVTVAWELIPPEEGSQLSDHDRLSSVIDRMGKWLRRRTGKKAVWARVIEPNSGAGFHVHMLVHVPEKDQRDFQAAFTGWLAKDASGLDYSHPKKLPVTFVPILKNQIQAHGLFKYLIKEGDDEVHEAQGLEPHLRARRTGKPVEGKRVKVSQSIDKAARKAALKAKNRPE